MLAASSGAPGEASASRTPWEEDAMAVRGSSRSHGEGARGTLVISWLRHRVCTGKRFPGGMLHALPLSLALFPNTRNVKRAFPIPCAGCVALQPPIAVPSARPRDSPASLLSTPAFKKALEKLLVLFRSLL